MNTIGLHCLVSGRVQGVFYRRATKKQADAMDVKGWVKNCPNGTVEVLLCGEESNVYKVRDWLWQGPFGARVDSVQETPVNYENLNNFEVRP